MRKIFTIIAICFVLMPFVKNEAAAQKKMSLVDSLKTIDPDLRKYFPRWRICEPDLCTKIYEAFVHLGFDKRKLDKQNIEVLAAPKRPKEKVYEILLISCGEFDLNALQISENIDQLERTISGRAYFNKNKNNNEITEFRNYCYTEIPPENPLKDAQAQEITDWFRPTTTKQSVSVSLFEQSLKIGNTGAWLHSKIGNDEIGYPFWTGAEGKIIFETPLYQNLGNDRKTLPYLIMANIGYNYRMKGGYDQSNTALSWVPDRLLNSAPGGKFVAGFDFNLPTYTNFGLHFNTEVPIKKLGREGINSVDDNIVTYTNNNIYFDDASIPDTVKTVAPMLRVSGQASLFYNLWIDDIFPEHFLRFDLGLQYNEVREYAFVNNPGGAYITSDSVHGLKLYKPNEFGDWIYAKVEYRNQAAFPFGISLQYSNQIFLGRVYFRLIGDFLFLEGKYSTPLRGVRPFEKENFFMISPVLRITI